jgi:hypothetical protein
VTTSYTNNVLNKYPTFIAYRAANIISFDAHNIEFATIIYLDGTGSDVAVMGQPSGEGRTIVESVLWHVLGQFELLLEGIDLFPIL